jgi:hypothetical protein
MLLLVFFVILVTIIALENDRSKNHLKDHGNEIIARTLI